MHRPPLEGTQRTPVEGTGCFSPSDHLLCGERLVLAPSCPWSHLILSSSRSLANPFRNPFPFSRIALLSVDLNAQGLHMRPECGFRSRPSPAGAGASVLSQTSHDCFSYLLTPRLYASSQPSFL